ncbi:heavy metal translocating P-type ATPase [Thermoactinomyces mirandus]|uniref:Cd(2+)-exporting ATPase n=1 Tax=Thermoactinomyces mirandus TaxID=2756294 RepID=A0A7W1XRZ4_9BACL|nr:heavy metal translocating P-type ATPase [Thermoactinomyces mirandus]MBA4602042.1 cadmium-translocating P-type ATPase [Thermoactinomyces mirandus]
MEQIRDKNVYRIQGLTCTNCAAQFERNVRNLPGVREAKVNFGASKITVFGEANIEQLEKAGAFESLKIAPQHVGTSARKVPLWKRKKNMFVLLSAFLLITAWLVSNSYGEENAWAVLLYSASMAVGGYRLFIHGLKNLLRLQFQMNTLMIIAILGAAAIGEWREGATVVILFAISEMLETFSMDKARESIRSLMEIAPKQALIRRNGEEKSIAVGEIETGDTMIVKPGQKIAMDGIVTKGTSTVNQAAITGESIPVSKTIDDEVYAGTLNGEGLLEVQVTRRAGDTTLAKIIHLVEEAQAERAPSQAFVDRFARIYTPAILITGLLLAIIPPLIFQADWYDWIYRGLAVLVVGCPCALVISTPVSIVTAIGNAARNGVLIKGGIHLEEMGQLKTIAFDKTGTLTKGAPVVTDLISMGSQKEKELLAIAAAMEKNSQHPLASALLRKAEEAKIHLTEYPVADFASLTGKGVQARVNGSLYYAGSPALFEERLPGGIPDRLRQQIKDRQLQGKTVILLGTELEILALIAVTDEVRENSAEVIEKLHGLGIQKTVMLTGDNNSTAQAIGQISGITETRAELLPQDKLEVIKQLRKDEGSVAMVGDGVNDAPALAAATVGVAMGGTGTDTALETADIALMGDDLGKLPFTIKLSRKTLQIIKQNITFALAIKAIALLLIITGWLTLWMAVFADMGATLIVTLNGLRLLNVQD